jgi:hypothetical protein
MRLRISPSSLPFASASLIFVTLACTQTEEPVQPGSGVGGAGAVAGMGGVAGGTTGGTGGAMTTGGAGGTGQGGVAGSFPQTGGTGNAGSSAGGTGGSAAGAAGSGGLAGSAGAAGDASNGGAGSAGASGMGGAAGNSGAGGMSGAAGGGMAGTAGSGPIPTERFSFFVTSVTAMKDLARAFGRGEQGFGGDLRYGETTGLAGADKICRTVAGRSMPGAENKTWRAFLSTIHGGPNDGPIHAIDRIGEGPWYDRIGRVVAMNKQALLNDRPQGADPLIINDLPNEDGVPNHTDGAPGCTGNDCPDNHDTLTGTGPDGHLYRTNDWSTCFDWTNGSSDQPMGDMGSAGRGGFAGANGPWCGHSWPRQGSGVNWMSALAEGGCAPGINLVEMGPPEPGVYTVGTGGGYGGIYCFALEP